MKDDPKSKIIPQLTPRPLPPGLPRVEIFVGQWGLADARKEKDF
jgi:hypothetical protein